MAEINQPHDQQMNSVSINLREMNDKAQNESVERESMYSQQEQMQIRSDFATELVKQERDIQEQGLHKDLNWLTAADVLYQKKFGKPPADMKPEERTKWLIDYMSEFNYNLAIGTIPMIKESSDMTDTESMALWYAMDTYDEKDVSLDGVGRFFKETLTDPTNYVGFGIGFGVSKVVKAGAKEAIKSSLKRRVINSLKRPVIKAASAEGAVYGAVDDLAIQQTEVNIGKREEIDPSQTATTAAIGATLAPAMVMGGEKIIKAVKGK